MQKENIAQDIIDYSKNKKIVLLWSGGFESTYLLKLFLSEKIYECCNLDVLSVIFPQDVYNIEKVHQSQEYLRSLGVNTSFIIPDIEIDKDAVAYTKACLVCKDIRRAIINKYIQDHAGESLSFVTGHNLDDLISYLLENIVTILEGNFEKKYNRYLETANKFVACFPYSESSIIFRPLLQFTKMSLQEDCFGELDQVFSVCEKECYWSKQRKRIFQLYLSQAERRFGFSKTQEMFKKIVGNPSLSDFRVLPFETYLL